MSEYFTFRFSQTSGIVLDTILIFTEQKPLVDSIIKSLKQEMEINPVCNQVVFLSPIRYKNVLAEIVKDKTFKKQYESLTATLLDSKLKIYFYDGKGAFCTSEGVFVDKKINILACEVKHILQSGAMEIFKNRRGLIESSSNYHFKKPSGDHCDKFIRTSNLLVNGSEVAFLALSLLPEFNANLKRIYVDTSSISYLVSTALRMSDLLQDAFVSIESFESYSVFNKPFDFVENADSLIIISATTSGTLAEKLIREHRFGAHQTITLFASCDLKQIKQIGLFRVSDLINGRITSTGASKCNFCNRGSKVINIYGDQFLPETPQHELIVIKKNDLSNSNTKFLEQYTTKKTLKCKPIINGTRDVNVDLMFFDVRELFNDTKNNLEKLNKFKHRHFNRHVSKIICLDDEGSIALATWIAPTDGTLTPVKVSDENFAELGNCGSVLVVAGAITSGRQLLSVSRRLRGLNELASITYFVGFSKLPSKEVEEQLRKDLELGEHKLAIFSSIPLPRQSHSGKSVWELEADFLRKFNNTDPLVGSASKLPELLTQRLAELDIQPNSHTDNEIFLKSPTGLTLKIRPSFAFWSNFDDVYDPELASDADIYWTIQIIMHELRSKNGGVGLGSIYHSTLISPANFTRFNDGIIQASLLRAAFPVELNYAIEENYSRQMTDIIRDVVNGWNDVQGEAALEFVLALLLKRIILCEVHLQEIKRLLNTQMPSDLKFLLNQL